MTAGGNVRWRGVLQGFLPFGTPRQFPERARGTLVWRGGAAPQISFANDLGVRALQRRDVPEPWDYRDLADSYSPAAR
jgi:hypothetical protein